MEIESLKRVLKIHKSILVLHSRKRSLQFFNVNAKNNYRQSYEFQNVSTVILIDT